MLFSKLPAAILFGLVLHGRVNAASSEDKPKVVEPCTIASSTGAFYDLRPLSIQPPSDDKKKPAKGVKTDDWFARGYDYHDHQANFTLNICAPVVEKKKDFVGFKGNQWKNVSAYYTLGSDTYSIG